MRFTEIDIRTITHGGRGYKHEQNFKEFLGMGVKSVEVLDHHYKSDKVARECLIVAAKKWAPNVKVVTSQGRIFLVRTDM